MDSEFFMNTGIPPPTLQFQLTSTMPKWPSLSSFAMEMQSDKLNCSTDQSTDCFFNPSWEKSTDQALQYNSALSSMVSSPAASNSNLSNESFMIRELIGKLGNLGDGSNSGEISPHSQPILAASYNITNSNNSAKASCYSTPLSSPPKLNLIPLDQLSQEKLNFRRKPLGLNSNIAELTADPGFAERAAKFSCFGSGSFNGRTNQFGLKNTNFAYRCNQNPLMENGKFSRVSSSPSFKAIGSQKGNKNSPLPENSSQEESSVSEHAKNVNSPVLKTSNELNSKKKKSVSNGKSKRKQHLNTSKHAETDENSNSKRKKPNEENGNEKDGVKTEEEQKDENQNKINSKPLEPPKDYIHVRARRGQATDSHSLAERVRREKISERMKFLQDLVPGCNKVSGKALMLDEIINYVQSLQRQVEFLSMKLASFNTRLDFNMDNLISKDILQSTNQRPHQSIFRLDSSASAIFGHQPQQNSALHGNISNGTVTQSSVDHLDSGLCQDLNMHLPQLEGFNYNVPQYPILCEDDLQTIIHMGLGKNSNQETPLQTNNFTGLNEVSHMKNEI